jgi:lipoprotein signal peptidase
MLHPHSLLRLFISKPWVTQLWAVVWIVIVNVAIGFLIQRLGVYFIKNIYPLGLPLPVLAVVIIFAVVAIGLVYTDCLHKFPLATLLIISGSVSNLGERILFGGVVDYLNLGIAYVNLADLELWFGVGLLNYQIWIEPMWKKMTLKPVV